MERHRAIRRLAPGVSESLTPSHHGAADELTKLGGPHQQGVRTEVESAAPKQAATQCHASA